MIRRLVENNRRHGQIATFTRCLATLLCLLPAWGLGYFESVSGNDPEQWMRNTFSDVARRDAFDGVNRIWFVFVVHVAVWCSITAVFVWVRAEKYIIPLLVGPFGLLAVYLSIEGYSDPAWFTLLALSCIAMFVSGVVTVVWFLTRRVKVRCLDEQ